MTFHLSNQAASTLDTPTKNTNQITTQMLIVDPAVTDYQSLTAGVAADTEIIVLNAEQDGVAQITQILGDRPSLQALHILSHGEAGALLLGNVRLDGQTLTDYAHTLQNWAKSLTHSAHILLYGCQVAAGQVGKQFVQQLSQLTQAQVAASTTLTGNAALGGDWNLEFTTGQQTPPLAFSAAAMQNYSAVLATTFLAETFTGADVVDKNWIFGVDRPNDPSRANPFLTARSTPAAPVGGLPGGGTDPVGQGTLRLTNSNNNQAGYVLYNKELPANAGLKITFDLHAYGGTGADGISFFLIDGATSPTTSGAFGGSLGYANRTTPFVDPGVVGGYLGIGFDEFGNYSNPTEGRVGGTGFVPDAVAIRGSEASGYNFITGQALPFSLDVPGAAATRDAARRRVDIEITQTGLLSVKVDGNQDNDFDDAGEQVITDFQVSSVSGLPPASFKFGFAASTGDNTNIHEIRNLVIVPITDAPETANVSLNVGVNTTTNVAGLSGTDADGIASFTINSLPAVEQGTLFLGNPARGGTPVTVGQVLTPAQISQVFFQSTPGFNQLTTFTYSATDSLGAEDATPGVVSLAPIGTPLPPPTTPPGVLVPPTEEERRRGCRLGEEKRGDRRSNRLFGTPLRQDTIFGRRGNDKILGDDCSDIVNGGLGRDNVSGNSGADLVKGRRGADRVKGNDGDDILQGQQGRDTVRGGKGRDRINAGIGGDRINGGLNGDNIRARRGVDRARGGGGRDTVRGQQGDDKILGGNGNDTLIGGQGADTIIGGRGKDTLFGKSGGDRFIFRSKRERGDRIVDFETSRDVIRISRRLVSSPNFAEDIKLVQSGGNTVVQVDLNGDRAGGFKTLTTLNGVDAATLSATNFAF